MANLLELHEDIEEVELVPLALPLDRKTIEWLNGLSDNDVEAAELIASILRDVREEDECAHRVLN